MGDHVYVKIEVHSSYLPKLIKNTEDNSLESLHEMTGCEDSFLEDEHYVFTASEVNYGEWDLLETFLRENEVEYDKCWTAGCDFEEGFAYFRCVEGEWKKIDIYKSNQERIDLIEILLQEKYIRKKAKEILKRLKPFEIKDLQRCPGNAEKFIDEIDD